MDFVNRYIQSLFFSKRFYWALASLIILFVFAYMSHLLFVIARVATLVFFVFVVIDYLVLFSKNGINVTRLLPDRLSNGDENKIHIDIANDYSFRSTAK